jgi:hypothetical protein
MTEYIVLIPDNELRWAAADAEEKQRVYGQHREFAEALAERGHKITGGAELVPSTQARTVRLGAEGLQVTEGPYAETVEQLSGFYVIESDDFDDLVQCAGILVDGEGAIEVRPCVDHSGGDSSA